MVFVESALLALSRRRASRLSEIRQRCEPKLRAPPVLREQDLEEAGVARFEAVFGAIFIEFGGGSSTF